MWMKKRSKRLNLYSWAQLDNLQRQLNDKAGNPFAVAEIVFQIIKLVDNRDYHKKFWLDVVKLLSEIQHANLPTKSFPMLSGKKKEDSDPLPWEYEGRAWYFWLNLFSANYGWGEEQIKQMDIDSAIGLYQEILIEEQLGQEWEWGLSDVSYSYDKNTKKSKFNKLPRPDWMLPIAPKVKKPVKKTKMLRTMLPQGLVVQLDGDDE
jgi:hypothetical protein